MTAGAVKSGACWVTNTLYAHIILLSKNGFIIIISCPGTALRFVENCSRANFTLRFFSSTRLVREQDLTILKPF
jgi:hypothetical protein